MNKLIVILTILLLPSFALASKEGVLPISSFTIESKGIGESGPIKITGQKHQDEITLLIVEAFGKEYKITADNLKKIHKASYNGIQISYEEGYKQLGGKTIYIILQMGFTSGVKKQMQISLTENNTVKVEEIKPTITK
ncbi:MAG TPA: hypothetical protein VJ440_02375 [Candidatus Brocadiaceae bacterium]|nr:hypothetical protein [Candidatus Brocadiaceae bacterium]